MSNVVKKDTGDILYAKPRADSDECNTPEYTVLPIVKYVLQYEAKIGRDIVVWLPFDKEDSKFVKVFKEIGIKFTNSHKDMEQDFFEYEPENWDIIVSNPPFKNKKLFFERALSFEKPFALLMAMTWLNDYAPYKVFGEYEADLQLLTFDKRTHFINQEGESMGRPSFGSAYFCRDFLPKQIITEKLDKKGEK